MKFRIDKQLTTVLLIAVILRIIFVIFFVNLGSDNYWEFGYIAKNIIAGKGYSLFYFTGNQICQEFDIATQPYPSAFMPPVYVYYLYPFLLINDIIVRNILLISSQIFLSILTIIFLYKLTSRLFSQNAGLIAALLVAVIPEFIYVTTVYNAVTQYHLLITVLLIILSSEEFFVKSKYLLYFSILSSLLILLRSEFTLLLILFLIIFLLKRKYKFVVSVIILISILISPWIIRNFVVFNDFIPLTTSRGLNFYRGHNPDRIGYWGDSYYLIDVREKSDNVNFEINYDKYFFEKGMDFVRENPGNEIINSLNKVFQLFFINPGDKRSFNPAYLIPSLLILIFSVTGIIKTYDFRKYNYLYLFLLASVITSVLFFTIPRYQIMMKICLIPFCAFYFKYILDLLKIKFSK